MGRGLRPSNPGSESPRLLRQPYAWPLSNARNRRTTKRYKQLFAAASAGRRRGRSALKCSPCPENLLDFAV